MTRDDFLSKVAEIAAEDPSYRLGGKGDDGTCDCIGLIIGAVERAGEDWDGIHGSNWWARNYTRDLRPVTDSDDLLPGDLVYKAREPGSAGYDLPRRYDGHPDQRDYYHVGVVTSVSPLRITHCTSPGGIMEDWKLGRWKYHGQLSLVDGESKGEEAMTAQGTMATVTAPSGKNVNMRSQPKSGAALVDRVPIGARVEVVESGPEWSGIRWNGKTGYMMTSFLALDRAQEAPQASGDGDLAQRVAELTAAVADLQVRVTMLEGGVSGG